MLYDKWTARKHLMGKVHEKTSEQADEILNCDTNIQIETVNTEQEALQSSPVISQTFSKKEEIIEESSLEENDPDKIGCPICSKMWHRSNLRNHLFYGHHMKTTEVQEVLLKLADPDSQSVKFDATMERTPCPMCERSFKVERTYKVSLYIISIKHWYNARRHLREHHNIEHSETVKMIRPPSEKKRKVK